MQKQEDERKEKGPEKMDAVNEEYGYSPDIGDEYKQLIKEGDRRRKRTEKGDENAMNRDIGIHL